MFVCLIKIAVLELLGGTQVAAAGSREKRVLGVAISQWRVPRRNVPFAIWKL